MVFFDAGVGEFWRRDLELAGRGYSIAVTLQCRVGDEIEVLLVVTPDRRIFSEFDALTLDPLLISRPLRPIGACSVSEGIWMRVPSALKRPAVVAWHRQFFTEHAEEFAVVIPSLGVDEQFRVPDTLPREEHLDERTVTSGILHVGHISLLRVSRPEPIVSMAGPPFRVYPTNSDPLGILYTNGTLGWMDAVLALPSSPERLQLNLELDRAGDDLET
jgi:hypothetical protein